MLCSVQSLLYWSTEGNSRLTSYTNIRGGNFRIIYVNKRTLYEHKLGDGLFNELKIILLYKYMKVLSSAYENNGSFSITCRKNGLKSRCLTNESLKIIGFFTIASHYKN
jgi:hypothetical protein